MVSLDTEADSIDSKTNSIGDGRLAAANSQRSYRHAAENEEPATKNRDRREKHNPVPLVRWPSGGGREVLRGPIPGFACRQGRRGARELPEREEGRRPIRRLHPDGPEVQRLERRTVLQVQRSRLPHRSVREPGRGGPILEGSLGGSRGRTVRLGEGPLRSFVADRANDAVRASCGPGSQKGRARDGSHAQDEEARHSDAATSLPVRQVTGGETHEEASCRHLSDPRRSDARAGRPG